MNSGLSEAKWKPKIENSGVTRPLKPPVTDVHVFSTCCPMKTSPSDATPR